MEPSLELVLGIFFFAIGGAIGSFLNVVIWRLPHHGQEVLLGEKRGPLTLSWPPSHCPVCDAPIRWYQNVPMVSWLFLRARCANCSTLIPVRYPLVELATAVCFAAFYLAYFVADWQPGFVNPIPWLPGGSWAQTAAFALHLALIASLLAATAIDIDLFIIPLVIPWLLALLGVVAAIFVNHPVIWKLHAAQVSSLATPIIGATVGLIAANVLLLYKILPRSFSSQPGETQAVARPPPAEPEANQPVPPPPKLTRFGTSAVAALVILLLAAASWGALPARGAALVCVVGGILIFLIGVLPRDPGQVDVTQEVLAEIASPHARREILKELAFVLLPIAGALAANWIPAPVPAYPWLARLLGSLLGLLAGGSIIWLVRIGGSLSLNKEAMGIGDVHLMAGIGAVIGARLVALAFMLAVCLGAIWSIILLILRRPNVLPFGPWLSIGSILALLIGEPLLNWYLSFLTR